MEGKKRYIIAIILFILLGLIIFSFASPSEELEEEKGNGNKNNQQEIIDYEDDDNDDEDTVDLEEGKGSSEEDKEVSQIVDNSYELALAAVKKAEKSLTTEDLKAALKLVEKVTDSKKEKQLSKRLDDVEAAIDAIALVEELEKLFNEDKTESDLTDSRTFRTEKDIVNLVSKLNNKTVKEDLTNRLNVLARVLDDETKPLISGAPENGKTKENVSLNITDATEVTKTATLDGNPIEYVDTFTQSGKYVIVFVDEAFNKEELTFIIDNIAPVLTINGDAIITLEKGKEVYTELYATMTDNLDETNASVEATTIYYTAPNSSSVKVDSVDNTMVGEYIITYSAQDSCGNTATDVTRKVIVEDTTKPEGEVAYSIKTPTNNNVVVTITANEEIITPVGYINTDATNQVFTKTYSNNVNEKITLTDLYGNSEEVSVVITNIDKVFNAATVDYSTKNPTNGDIVVTLTFDEVVETPNGFTKADSDGKVFTKTYAANVAELVTATDTAGNTQNINVVITNIDKVFNAPVIYYSNKNLTNQDIIVRIEFDEEVTGVTGFTMVGTDNKIFTKTYIENTTEKLTVTDKAGNTQEINISISNIEKNPPVIIDGNTGEAITMNGFYKNVKPVITDENLDPDAVKLNGFNFTSGTTITTNFKHTLVATDKAGNSTTVTFTVDNIKPHILLLDRISVLQSGLIPIKPVIVEANLKELILEKDGVVIPYSFDENNMGAQITEPGKYKLTAIDKAGNVSDTATFSIDNEAPIFYKESTLISQDTKIIFGAAYQDDVKVRIEDDNFDPNKVLVFKQASVKIYGVEIPTYNPYEYTYGDTLTEEGTYVIVTSDDALNIAFTMFTIDKTDPEVNAENGAFYPSLDLVVTDANLASVTITRTYSDGGLIPKTETLDYEEGMTLSKEGLYSVTAVDRALRTTMRIFTIDATVPRIEGVVEGGIYTSVRPVIVESNILSAKLNGNNFTSKTLVDEAGAYTLVVTDKANQTASVTFTIDPEVLTIGNITNEKGYNGTVENPFVPQINNKAQIETATLNGNAYTKGEGITTEGKYTLVVKDIYGNTITREFYIDNTAPDILASNKEVPGIDGTSINLTVTATDVLPTSQSVKPDVYLGGTLVGEELSKLDTEVANIGVYTLVYEAKDAVGNKGTKTVTLEVLAADAYLQFDANEITKTFTNSDQLDDLNIELIDVATGNPVTIDRSNIEFTVTGTDTQLFNVGTYTVTAKVKDGATEYRYIPESSVTYIIDPMDVEIIIEEDSSNTSKYATNMFEYDGYTKKYNAKVVEVGNSSNVIQTETLETGANVGTYTLTAKPTVSSNYKLAETEKSIDVRITIASVRAELEVVNGEVVVKSLKNTNGTPIAVTIPYTIEYEKRGRTLISFPIKVYEWNATTDISAAGTYRATVKFEKTDNYAASLTGLTTEFTK